MGYNPDDPKVKAAKQFAEEFEFDEVVIVGISHKREVISGTSYGRTKRLCNKAKSKMNTAYNAVVNFMRRN